MSKSRARFLAELLNSSGLVKESRSALAGEDGIVDLDNLPTITNAKLENSSISIAGHSTALGGSVTLDINDITDVTITTPASGEFLRYNGTAWVNSTIQTGDITSGMVTQHQGDLSITESQISDLQSYLTSYTETNDLSSAVTWANVPDANITQSSVTQHEAALSITESQISDLQSYLTSHQSLAAYATLASPALTGTPTAPTADEGTNTTQIATTAFVTTAVDNIVDAAPGSLDTLNELAAALGDDASFSTTVTNSIATKLPLAGGTMTGALNMGGNDISNTGDIAIGSAGEISDASNYSQISGKSDDTTGIALYGGSTYNTGGGIVIYGNQHASKAGETWFYYDGFSQRMVINSTGTAITDRLGVNTTDLTPVLKVTNDDNGNSHYGYYNTATQTADYSRNLFTHGVNGSFTVRKYDDPTTTYTKHLVIDNSGDISFYNSAGTSPDLYWDASESRLGIGTSSPSRNLEVESSSAQIALDSTGSTYSRVEHQHNGTAIWTTGTRASNDYHIYRESGGGDVIVDAGNVGINNVSPSYPLDVTGNARVTSGLLFGSTTSYLYEGGANQVNIRIGADGPYLEFIDAGSNVAEVGNASGPLALTSAGTERVRIDNSGNITTAADGQTLTVLSAAGDVVLGGSGTIAGATWANGAFHLGTASSGWAMDPNELYNSGAAIIGTLSGDLSLNPAGNVTIGGSRVLTTADEGSGSGLDADTLDGIQASSFLRSDASDTMTGSLTIDTDNQANGALRIANNVTDTNNDFYFAQEIVQTLSGSQAATGDREQGGIYLDINSSNTGGDVDNEHRAYGMYIDLDSTGDADNIYGIYSNATATPSTGSTTGIYGGYFWAEDNGGAGATTNVHGIVGFAYSDNATSDINNMYGGYFKSYNAADSGPISNAHGVYSEVEITSGSGDIYGNTYVYRAELDNNAGAQSNNTFLYYGNYAGTLPTTAYGVYIADAVDNYFEGAVRSATAFRIANTTVIDANRNLTNLSFSQASAAWNPALLEDGGTVKKDDSVQIHGSGYLRASYLNMSHSAGTRSTDTVFYSSTDDYIRKTNATGMRSSLNVPTRTGGDASGTWGINITGSAGTVDGIDSSRIVFGSNATGTYNANPTVTSSPYQKSGFYDIYQTNAPTSTWYSYINMRHNNTGNNYGHQIAGSFYSTGDIYNRNINNNSYGSWTKIWNASNDGSGSGLDADLLDGQHGSYYSNYNNLSNKPTIPTNNNQLTNGAGYITSADGGNAGTLDGLDSTAFIRANANDNVTGHTEWQDNYNIRLGNSADTRIWHDGSHTTIRSYKHGQNIYIQGENSSGTNQAIAYFRGDSTNGAQLYAAGSLKFYTWSGGAVCQGDLTATGNNTATLIRVSATNANAARPIVCTEVGNGTQNSSNLYKDQFGGFTYNPSLNEIIVNGGSFADNEFQGNTLVGDSLDLRLNSSTGISIVEGNSTELYIRNKGSGKMSFQQGAAETERMYLTNAGTLYVDGTYQTFSDERLKDNIQPIENALNKVSSLNGVTFTRKEMDDESTGLIAQDVEKVLPEAVQTNEDGYKTIAYGNTVGLLVEAIKELKAEVDELKTKLGEK